MRLRLEKYPENATIERKNIPKFLKRAGERHIKKDSLAGIFYCRLVFELALRDKILDKNNKKEVGGTLGCLLRRAIELGSIKENTMNDIFFNLKNKNNPYHKNRNKIQDKFIHGDYAWLKDYLEKERGVKIAENEKAKKEIIGHPGVISGFLFIEIFKATYKVIDVLYPEVNKNGYKII